MTRRPESAQPRRLAQHEFVADDYSIVDIAIWPCISGYEWQKLVKRSLTTLSGSGRVMCSTKLQPETGKRPTAPARLARIRRRCWSRWNPKSAQQIERLVV
jgi:hypothetical protein